MHKILVPLMMLLAAACSSSGISRSSSSSVAEIRTEEVTYRAGDVECHGYLAWDASVEGPRPGVLVVHEWWGHNEYARRRARMLASMGYTALALDMFGGGKEASHPEDATKFMMEVMGDLSVARERFEAAKQVLNAHPSTDAAQTSAIGYCMGGGVVLHMARQGLELDGVASFHGSLGTKARAQSGDIKARMLVCHGAADPFVTEEELAGFHGEMEDAGVDLSFVSYPGALHAFTNPGATAKGEEFGLPLAYDEAADHGSWTELERFLGEIYGD